MATPSDLVVDLAGADSANLIFLRLAVKPDINFSITFKLKVKRPKTTSGYIEQVWVHGPWPVPPTWSLKPAVDQKGCVKLNSHQLTWRGRGRGELALNLGGVPTTLDKMELVAMEGVEEMGVALISSQCTISTGIFSSVYPKKYTFPRPIIASTITIQPVEYEKKDPNDERPPGPSPLQLQLHGNTAGEPLEVEDGGLLNFQFNTLKPNQQLYFYIMCLEETGAITISNCNEGEEVAKLVYEYEKGKYVFPPKKLFVQAKIPPGYTPAAGQMCDKYSVWVSPTWLCVEPFLQRGIHNHYQPLSFNILSWERREGVVTDEWFNHHYTVKVNKS